MTSNVNAMEVDASAYPRPTDLPNTDHVILDVDGRKYRTRKSILKNCDYFANLLSGQWAVDLLPDGSLPIDTDPEIWPTLFAYIKRPAMYPLLWTREKGFDYVGYSKLLAEADFFGLDDLKQWILSKSYMRAIETKFNLQVLSGVQRPYCGGADGQWLRREPPEDFALQVPEDVELVSCFEAKIASQGNYKCLSGSRFHTDIDDCVEEGCELSFGPRGDELQEHETAPTSIVAVLKYIEHNPQACTHGYVKPEDD